MKETKLKRREFLKSTLGSLAGVPILLSPLLPQQVRAACEALIDSTFDGDVSVDYGPVLMNKIKRAPSRIAFGSCLQQTRPQPVWQAIEKYDPNLFVFLGDNIYGDTCDMNVLRRKYRQLGTHPEFARFRARYPIAATWDDHDFGMDDEGMSYPFKEDSKKIMLNFFGEPKISERRHRQGIYTSYLMGQGSRRLQLILLDLRWSRSELKKNENGDYIPNDDPDATLLGDEQWAWLEEQLKVPADLRILGSSIQFASSEHRWEKWENYPHEKARLLGLLDQYDVRNLIVISGDMHFAELSVEQTPRGTPVWDMTASGLNRFETAAPYPNSKRVAVYDQSEHFGLITIDWATRPLRVTMEAVDYRGRSRIRKTVEV